MCQFFIFGQLYDKIGKKNGLQARTRSPQIYTIVQELFCVSSDKVSHFIRNAKSAFRTAAAFRYRLVFHRLQRRGRRTLLFLRCSLRHTSSYFPLAMYGRIPNQWLAYAARTDRRTAVTMSRPVKASTARTAQNEQHFGHFAIFSRIRATASGSPIWQASVAHAITAKACHIMTRRPL